MLKDTPGTTQSRSSSSGKRIQILWGINIHIFDCIFQEYAGVSVAELV
jgi:hypothetical protein